MFDVHVVRSRSNTAYAAQLDDMFRQRYDVFIRKLKWDIPGVDHRLGREMDQFDGPDTVYLLVMDGSAVLGASRMVPTTEPARRFPHPVHGRPARRQRCLGVVQGARQTR